MREASHFACPSGEVRTVASIKIRVILERVAMTAVVASRRFGGYDIALAQAFGFGFQKT
jgi:hypothetical protein